MRASWSRAARGSGSVAFLSGEAGIGKSRLAAELATLVRDQGGQTLVGATSHPEGEPYQSVVVALRAAVALVARARIDDAWLGALAAVLPELAGLREGLASEELAPTARGTGSSKPSLGSWNTSRACGRSASCWKTCTGRDRPRSNSWARSRGASVRWRCCWSNYRSEESAAAGPLRKLRAALIAERRASALPLERLGTGDVERVVSAVVESGPARAALRDGIASLSEGNPLFVVQLIEGYLETGNVPDESSALRSVGDAIADRARRLSSQVRAVAEVAATIGQSFRADMVADAGGWDENVVLDSIGELMDRALVRDSGGELEYVFTHALVGATLYRNSSRELRTARHRRIATLLERSRGDAPEAAAALAMHWRLAGEAPRAARASIRAGEAALNRYARSEAIAHAREALELTRDPLDSFRALMLLSQAQLRHGDTAQWKSDLEALLQCAGELGIEERFAALEQRSLFEHQVADRPGQRRSIEAMLELAAGADVPRMRCTALALLGRLESIQGRVAEAFAALEEALSIAVDCAAADVEVDVRYMLAHTLARVGRYEEAQRQALAFRGGPDAASGKRRTRALQIDIAIAGSRQDAAAAGAAAASMLEIARATGDMELEVSALVQLAWAEHAKIDAQAVRERYREALAISERIGYESGIETVSLDLGGSRRTSAITGRR